MGAATIAVIFGPQVQGWLRGLAVMTLLALTFLVGSITLASGRTHLMHGAVHRVLFAAFLFLTLVP